MSRTRWIMLAVSLFPAGVLAQTQPPVPPTQPAPTQPPPTTPPQPTPPAQEVHTPPPAPEPLVPAEEGQPVSGTEPAPQEAVVHTAAPKMNIGVSLGGGVAELTKGFMGDATDVGGIGEVRITYGLHKLVSFE